jgi:hypothetical protein
MELTDKEAMEIIEGRVKPSIKEGLKRIWLYIVLGIFIFIGLFWVMAVFPSPDAGQSTYQISSGGELIVDRNGSAQFNGVALVPVKTVGRPYVAQVCIGISVLVLLLLIYQRGAKQFTYLVDKSREAAFAHYKSTGELPPIPLQKIKVRK